MKTLALAVLAAVPLFAVDQALVLDSPQTGSYTIPSSVPFTSVDQVRVEIRILGPVSCANFPYFWYWGPFALRCFAATQLDWEDVPNSIGALFPTPSQADITLRMQWDGANSLGNGAGCRYVEVWNTSTGAVIGSLVTDCRGGGGSRSIAGASTIGNGTDITTLRVGWVRVYKTVVATAGTIPANQPVADPNRIADWELDGNLTESSGVCNCDLTAPGATFVNTPDYPPVPVVTLPGQTTYITQPSLRANTNTNVLDGSGSYSVEHTITTYAWSQTAGPTKISWSSTAVASPTISNLGFGQYGARLQVTDSIGQTASIDVTFGAVNTNSNYVVQSSDVNVDKMLGPMLLYGRSPWPYQDQKHFSLVDAYSSWVSSLWTPIDTPAEDPGTCAVSIANGGTALTGSAGCHLQTQTGCSGACTNPNGVVVLLWYNGNVANGRAHSFISSCASETACTATFAWTGPSVTSKPYSVLVPNNCPICYVYWYSIGGAYHWNGYDLVLATYALWARTGLTVYKTRADDMANHWYRGPEIDAGGCWTYGDCISAPRGASLMGLELATYLGASGLSWTGIYDFLNGWQSDLQVNAPPSDVRELAYETTGTAWAAQFGTSAPGAYLTNLATVVNQRWVPGQCPAVNRPNCQTGATPYIVLAWSTWNNAAGYATVTPGSATVTFEPGKLAPAISWATNGQSTTDLTNSLDKQFRFSDQNQAGQSLNDTTYYTWTATPVADQVTLDRPYAGTCPGNTASCQKDWTLNNVPGFGTQAWHQGFSAMAMHYASEALKTANPTASTAALNHLLATAGWLSTYGVQSSIHGVYNCRMFMTAEPPETTTAYDVSNCSVRTNQWTEDAGHGTSILDVWFDAGELARGLSAAYVQTTSPSLKAAGDTIIGAALGAHGGPDNVLGCANPSGFCYAEELDEITPLPGSYKARDVGFWYGAGGSYTWAAARLSTTATSPGTSISGKTSFSGTVSIR